MRQIIAKSRISNKKNDVYKQTKEDVRRIDLLMQCQSCWDNLRTFREDRERNRRYTYGNQWGDVIKDENGKHMSEEDYIINQGSIPLKNNLIRRLVRTVSGVYRSQNKEPMCLANDRDEQKLGETMSITLQYNWRLNKMSEINARLFEEFLIGGFVISKESFGWRNDRMDCWTDTVHPNYIFLDGNMQDFRYWDLSLIGEIHDISFGDLCSKFANSNKDCERLKEIYKISSSQSSLMRDNELLTANNNKALNLDFLFPKERNLCRVIEVWKKEQKPRFRCHDYLNGDWYKDELSNEKNIIEENKSRIEQGISAGMAEDDIPLIEYEWFIDSFWYYRFLSPTGYTLTEGESTYNHKSHPYTIKIYPFIDGETHSFVSDVIDQQRYINRLITLNDWVIRAGAKGVMMFPEELLPDGYSIEDIASEWIKPNGFILYKSKPNVELPKQISNNSTNIGIREMLQLQMGLMEDVSGVTGAMQGKPGYSGMSASLYSQQQQNASSSLLDMLESFSSFVCEGAIKKTKNIQQFYDEKKIINIAGKNAVVEYDPDKIRDVEFDLSIVESQYSPVTRAMSNDLLLQLFQSSAISIEQLLSCGNFPFADTLLQSIKSQKEQLEEGEIPAAIPNDIKGQINANAGAVEMLNKSLQ